MTPTSVELTLVRVAFLVLFCSLLAKPAAATDPALSGSVNVVFSFHPDDPNTSGDQSYWYFDHVDNNMVLSIPPVIDTTIKPSAIGAGTLDWSDKTIWVQPANNSRLFRAI